MNSPSKSIHDSVSICLYLGAAQGAWKYAPIILLANYHALILHAHPVFDIQNTPC